MENKQWFNNNFNNYENTRFDFGIAMIMTLFSKENQDLINKKIKEQLIDVQAVEDSNSSTKGLVYANESDDIDKSRIFYVKHDENNVAYSWHMIVHELTHFIGKPDKKTIENEITGSSDKSELGGTQIFDFTTNSEYGNFFNECGADLLCEMAMTTSIECRETNPQIKSADDIIYTNNRYQKTDYDTLSTIARLMAVAMDNNFSKQTYDKMIHSDSGLIDRQVQMINQQTGELIDTVPTNDYLYAMAGYGKHLEEQFDKYSQPGSYREMCSFLDGEIKALQKGENHIVDKNKLKEQLLRMADMVNNKMYILQNNKCITQEQRDNFVGRFNFVFNQALQEYNIGPLTPEDIKKITQSMNRTIEEQKNKKQHENGVNEKEKNIPEGYRINEFGEIIRPDMSQGVDDFAISNDIPTFEPPTNIEQTIDSNLSLKQKIAQLFQRSNFMNIPFVERFVNRQLKALPSPNSEKTVTSTDSKKQFIDWLSGNGEYKNLPPIQRMSSEDKLDTMQKKMDLKQKEDDDLTL